MAEALLDHRGRGRFKVYSVGSFPNAALLRYLPNAAQQREHLGARGRQSADVDFTRDDMPVTRRALLLSSAADVALLASERARFLLCGGNAIRAAQAITGVNPTSMIVVGGSGSAGVSIGTMTVAMGPGAPPFSPAFALSGRDACAFVIDSGTGQLRVGPNDIGPGTYHFDIVPTQTGGAGSGTPFPVMVQAVGRGASITLDPPVTRPNDTNYPQSKFVAKVAGGPGNPQDRIAIFYPDGRDTGRWLYLNGSQTPPASGLTSASVTFNALPTNGNWSVRFLSTGNSVLAAATLRIATLTVAQIFPVMAAGSSSCNVFTAGLRTAGARRPTAP
jgi:hypothetical protein